VEQRLREELAKLQVEVNEDKSRKVDLQRGEASDFWGLSSVGSGVIRRWMLPLLPKSKQKERASYANSRPYPVPLSLSR